MPYTNDVTFDIVEHIADLSEPTASGWVTELNIVSWNGRQPKYDIRNWNADHTRSSKISTFTREGLEKLFEVMQELNIDEIPDLE